jgi:hypothetical protein
MTPRCFVSISAGQRSTASGELIDFEYVYEHLIEPAVRAFNYEPCRTLDYFGNGAIMDVAVRLLAESDMMIADLTTLNANVVHEVGVRQAFLPTGLVLIMRRGERLPFNLNQTFVHWYDELTPDNAANEVERLKVPFANIMADKNPNPIYRQARWARDYDEHQVALQEFHTTAPFDRSIFVMTKFPETEARKQSDDDKKLERVISKVREAVKEQGYLARLASDKQYYDVLWKNIEIYLIGCARALQ